MKGNATVIANLLDAAAGEAHIALQLRLDAQVLKAFGTKSLGSKLKGMASTAHDILHGKPEGIVWRLLSFGVEAQYDAGTATAGKPVIAILKNAMALISDLTQKYEGYAKQAWDASDDETRNNYEHYIKRHHQSILWLERQLALITALGGEA